MARNFASQTTDQITWSGGALLYNQTAASIMCWFRHPGSPASGNFPAIFTQAAAFNIDVHLSLVAGGANDGKLECFWRTPTDIVNFNSTSTWDDNAWHRLLFVRRSTSPYVEIYIDGVSDGSSTTDPGTDASAAVNQEWGQYGVVGDSSWGGDLARCGFVTGHSLTPEEADVFLFHAGKWPRNLDQWLELWGVNSPEPDSASGLNGTVTGATQSDHPPQCALRRGMSRSLLVYGRRSPYYMNYYKRVVLGMAA